MLVSFNPSLSSNLHKKQNPSFGSFPAPKNYREAMNLRDQVTFKELLPTPDNIESWKIAYKSSEKVVKALLGNIAEKWGYKAEELAK